MKSTKTKNNPSLHEVFSEALSKLHPINCKDKVAIAVSGGADSMALVLLVNKLMKGKNVLAITVDHGLRKESASEANKVKQWMESQGIEHHILRWEGDKKNSNIQAEARYVRYRLMTGLCKQKGVDYLFVAHNKEDQAETVLLRLMRGSGVDGLSGIADEVDINGVKILRPLLNITKNTLKEFLQQEGQEWVEDPSNENTKYSRVSIRKFIQNSEDPYLLVSRLADTANNMQRSRSYIEEKVSLEMAWVSQIRPEGYCLLDIGKFKKLHREAAYRILSILIQNIGGDYYKPRFEKIKKLYDFIIAGEFFEGCTVGGCNISRALKKKEAGKVIISREFSALQDDIDIVWGEDIVWDNRFICNSGEIYGSGFKIGALGSDGFKKLSSSFSKLEKTVLPKKIIYTTPVIKKLENIVYAPHIGYCEDKKYEDNFKIIFKYC